MSDKAKVFDLSAMEARSYHERDKNVFYSMQAFKARIIELGPGGEMPLCKMETHVIFVIIEGKAIVKVDDEDFVMEKDMCLITPPASISMSAKTGVRMLGIQIHRDSP